MQSKSSALHNYEDYLTIFHAKTGAPVYVHQTVAEKMLGSGLYHGLDRHLSSHQPAGFNAPHATLENSHEKRTQDNEQNIRSECAQDEKGNEANHVDKNTGCVCASSQFGNQGLSYPQQENVTCVEQYIKLNGKKRGRPKKEMII